MRVGDGSLVANGANITLKNCKKLLLNLFISIIVLSPLRGIPLRLRMGEQAFCLRGELYLFARFLFPLGNLRDLLTDSEWKIEIPPRADAKIAVID